uniref:EGF-like domain-containing protein n=1 Tax=Schistocephalus solidus TaxID=70667 RepID=A0A0X3QH78_SCHSO
MSHNQLRHAHSRRSTAILVSQNAVSVPPARAQKMHSTGYLGWVLLALTTSALNSSLTPGDQQNGTNDGTTRMLSMSKTEVVPAMLRTDPPRQDPCPKCYGESVCVRFPNGSYGCHCPPEYSGPLCRTSIPIYAESCNRHVCKNGAGCLIFENRAQCFCPVNYVGIQCNRVAVIFEVALHLHSESHVVNWFHPGEDASAYETGHEANVVCNGLRGFIKYGVSKEVAVAYAGCIPHHLHRFDREMAADGVEAVTSGMDAEVHLIFDPGEDAHIFNVDDIRRQILTGYLATTLLNPSLPNIEWDDSLIISVVDQCKTGHHDCSEYATCHGKSGTYSCTCNTAYTDKSHENGYLPGRICSLHGGLALFVGGLVMTPFVVGAVILLIFLRRRERRRFWIFRNRTSDVLQLMDSPTCHTST